MNIYDIAREANVSISTVSKYLNHKNIRPELKERVEAVIKKYNYVPSAIARGLVSKSLKTIAVFVVDIRVSYYSVIAFELDKLLTPLGYRVVICNTLGDVRSSISYLENLLTINVDGIVFVGSVFNFLNDYPDTLNKLNNIPVVCNNGHIDVNNSYSVYVNDKLGVYEATKYLINKGRKKIHYIKYLDTASANYKLEGYKAAMLEGNLTPVVHNTALFFEGGYEVLNKVIEEKEDFDAFVCGEDLVAVGALNCLTENGYRVGEDVDVIGYNNSEYSNLATPKLTSVDNMTEVVAKKCAEILIAVLSSKEVNKDYVVDPKIVYKKSA